MQDKRCFQLSVAKKYHQFIIEFLSHAKAVDGRHAGAPRDCRDVTLTSATDFRSPREADTSRLAVRTSHHFLWFGFRFS